MNFSTTPSCLKPFWNIFFRVLGYLKNSSVIFSFVVFFSCPSVFYSVSFMVSFLWCSSCYRNFFVALKTRFSEILFFGVSGKFFSIVSALFFSLLLCTSFLLLWNSSFRYSCIVLSSAKFFILLLPLHCSFYLVWNSLVLPFFITFNLLLLYSFALFFIIRIFHSFESRTKSSISNSSSLRFSYFFKYLVWYILELHLITKIAIVKLFSSVWSFVLQLLIQNSYFRRILILEK